MPECCRKKSSTLASNWQSPFEIYCTHWIVKCDDVTNAFYKIWLGDMWASTASFNISISVLSSDDQINRLHCFSNFQSSHQGLQRVYNVYGTNENQCCTNLVRLYSSDCTALLTHWTYRVDYHHGWHSGLVYADNCSYRNFFYYRNKFEKIRLLISRTLNYFMRI